MQPRVRLGFGIGVLILVMGVIGYAFLGNGIAGSSSSHAPWGQKAEVTSASVGTSVGARAPAFELTSIDGDAIPYRLDKPKVIFFMAAWCGSCIPEEQALAKLHRQYGDRVQIVSVDADPKNDRPADTRRFQRQYGGPWPHALSGEMVRLFRVRSLDTTFVLNRNNVITYRDAHPTEYETLQRQIRKVLPENSS